MMNAVSFNRRCIQVRHSRASTFCPPAPQKKLLRAQTQSSEDLNEEQDASLLKGLKFLDRKGRKMERADVLSVVGLVEKEIRERIEHHRAFVFDQKNTKPSRSLSLEIGAPVEIDERDPQRAPFHDRLFQAGMEAKSSDAEEVIKEMLALGIQPGPRAYHTLIFAYTKAKSPSGALNAIRRAHASGLNPLTESYLLLIHGFMEERNVRNAEAVFRSMRRPDANANAEAGWRMLTSKLFQNCCYVRATTLLEDGRKENFMPDNKLFALSIKHDCDENRIDTALDQLYEIVNHEAEYKDKGTLQCTADHVEPLLSHFGAKGALPMTLWLFTLPKQTSISAYNTTLLAIIKTWDEIDCDLSNLFNHVWNKLELDDEVFEDEESLILYAIAKIKRGHALDAQRIFIHRQLADAKGEKEQKMICDLLSRLLVGLSVQGLPIALYNLIQMVSIANIAIPEEALVPDSRGRTFVSQWLDDRSEIIKAQMSTSIDKEQDGIEITPDGRRIRVINGINIGYGDCVVDNNGNIKPISQLKVLELRAECKARGLVVSGNRKEYYDAVRLARRSVPTIQDQIKRGRKLARKQVKMTTPKKSKRSNRKEKKDHAVTIYHRHSYKHGKLIKAEVLERDEAEILLSKPEPKSEADELDEDDDLADARVALKSDPNPPQWSDLYVLTSRQHADLGTDQTACGNAAVAMTALLCRLSAFPTLEDFEAMTYVIDETRNPAAAWKLGNLISKEQLIFKTEKRDPDEMEEEYSSRLRRIFHVCARLCLTCRFPDSCEQLASKMKELGHQPDAILLEEIKQFREKGSTELDGKYPSREIDTSPVPNEAFPMIVVDPSRRVRPDAPFSDIEEEDEEEREKDGSEKRLDFYASSGPRDEDDDVESLSRVNAIDRDEADFKTMSNASDATNSDRDGLFADNEI